MKKMRDKVCNNCSLMTSPAVHKAMVIGRMIVDAWKKGRDGKDSASCNKHHIYIILLELVIKIQK